LPRSVKQPRPHWLGCASERSSSSYSRGEGGNSEERCTDARRPASTRPLRSPPRPLPRAPPSTARPPSPSAPRRGTPTSSASRVSRRPAPTPLPRSVSTPPSTPGPTRASSRPLTTPRSAVVTSVRARDGGCSDVGAARVVQKRSTV
jgi:hypothetical protein